MSLLDAFTAWAGGEVQALAVLKPIAEQLCDAGGDRDLRDEAVDTVLRRLWRSRIECLETLWDVRAAPSEELLSRLGVRGAEPAEVEAVLGRPLEPHELDALNPLRSEARARAYLRAALRNAVRDIRRRARREVSLEQPPSTPTPDPVERAALREAEALLDRLLPGLEEWGNRRDRRFGRAGTDSLEALAELAELSAEGEAVPEGESAKEAQRRWKRWSRARARLLDYILDCRLSPDERRLVPLVQRLVDVRYRLHARQVVRRPSDRRLHPDEKEPES